MHPFLHRVQNRKVTQWAAAYLAGAWLLLQLLELLADVYAWHPALLRTVVPVLAVGFLAALVVAWFHGEKGNQRLSGLELGVLTGIVVLDGAVVVFVGGGAGAVAADPSSSEPKAPMDGSSVAVLPFLNMSPDPDQEYFSDGITEELLHALAKVPGLYVPARTSSFAFKGANAPVQEIAASLGVAHVLEGSVRTAGDGADRTVRVTAQLIDAGTGGHVWAETYDRGMEDIFAIQEEIAQSIVAALRTRLDLEPERHENLVAGGTESIEAYQAYLRALAAFNERRNRAVVESADEAIALDSGFPQPHAIRAAAFAAAGGSAAGWVGRKEAFEHAEASARRAIELDPSLALAHSSMGLIHDNRWNWERAEAAHRAAVRVDPADADARHWFGWHLLRMGRLEDAVTQLRQATILDPLAPTTRRNYALALSFMGRHEEARREAGRALVLWGERDDVFARSVQGLSAAMLGDTAAARRAVHSDAPNRMPYPTEAGVLALIGDTARARSALDHHLRTTPDDERLSFAAMAYAILGDSERAIALLEEAFQRGDPAMFVVLRAPAFDSIRNDTRVAHLFRQAGL